MSKAAELAALIGSQTALSNRNLVINGAFQVWQRATAATAVGGNDVYNTADRWVFYSNTDGEFTTEQSTDVPSGQGFEYSLKAAVTTADTSLSSGQVSIIGQKIEAQNLSQLNYGTSSAKTMTITFWAKSNKTDTYEFSIEKDDETDYIFVKDFSISSANTWEKKTIKIIPDSNIKASAGAITHDNGTGFRLLWSFALGSTYTGGTDGAWTTDTDFGTTNQVNWMDSTSNEWYITGIQLEVGEQATPFEHRSFADELLRCQRYFINFPDTSSGTNAVFCGRGNGTTQAVAVMMPLPVVMRSTPTISQISSLSAIGPSGYNAASNVTPTVTGTPTFETCLSLSFTGLSGLTDNRLAGVYIFNPFSLSAEL